MNSHLISDHQPPGETMMIFRPRTECLTSLLFLLCTLRTFFLLLSLFRGGGGYHFAFGSSLSPYNHACALLDFWSVAFYQRLLHPYPTDRPCLHFLRVLLLRGGSSSSSSAQPDTNIFRLSRHWFVGVIFLLWGGCVEGTFWEQSLEGARSE